MLTGSETFRLAEYKALRKEIEIYLSESRSLERYTVIAVGVIWGWLITNHNDNWLGWTIPIVLTALAAGRRIGMNRHFKTLGGHIAGIESKFGVTGWENRDKNKSLSLGTTELVVDLTLVASAVAGLLLLGELTLKNGS